MSNLAAESFISGYNGYFFSSFCLILKIEKIGTAKFPHFK